MNPDIQLGLQLLLVGMLTVFFILGIVILLGKLLINVANRFAPEETQPVRRSRSRIPSKHIAILAAAVQEITNGQGQLSSIKKTHVDGKGN